MNRFFQRLFSSRSESPALEATTAKVEGDDAEAHYNLGLKFAADGAGQDQERAAHWFRKAADKNHAKAQFKLGVMYAKGQGVPRDNALSLMWISKAADLGDAGAQYTLGMRLRRLSLEEGPEDAMESMIEAYKWLQLAARQGYAKAEVDRDSVALDITRESVAEGSHRAAAFVPARA